MLEYRWQNVRGEKCFMYETNNLIISGNGQRLVLGQSTKVTDFFKFCNGILSFYYYQHMQSGRARLFPAVNVFNMHFLFCDIFRCSVNICRHFYKHIFFAKTTTGRDHAFQLVKTHSQLML